MLSKKSAHNPVELTEDELDAALRLLTVERAVGPDSPSRRDLIYSLAASLGIGIFLVALPLGLAVVWFDWIWGVGLMAFGLGSLAVAMFTKDRSPETQTRRLRDSLVGSEIEEVASAVWTKRELASDRALVLILIGGAAVTIYGLIRLGFSLADSGDVDWFALILIIIPPSAFWSFFAWIEYREYKYFVDVASVRTRLETESASGVGDRAAEITSAEFEVVSRAETQQIERGIEEAMRTVTATEPESYSVVLAPTVLESFADLNSETYYEVRRVIDSLQVNPQPPDATPALEGKRAETELRIAAHPSIMISYSVDDENRQVMVEEIDQSEISDAPN